jgi:protein-L-isoaspartate(D-aspartate) O-methyltransferase
MTDLVDRRRFFAEEIQAVANITTPALVDALATIPRERYLRRGPWQVLGEGNVLGTPRATPDADPRHVYHNYAIGIEPGRQLFNGSPALIAGLIERLALTTGSRVLHVGAGLGYYSAVMGHLVGPTGKVIATEIDEALASEARVNVSAMPWVQIRSAADTARVEECFDAILVNAGVTHPQDAWLDALEPGGRLVIPLTAAITAMGPIGKGVMVLITRTGEDAYDARVLTFVAIYSGIGLRDQAINEELGKALMRMPFPRLQRLRRDTHVQSADCWLHADGFCFSTT